MSEIGEIVVTSFRRTYPLIRFGTGDLSLYTDEPCPCGRSSPRLLGIVGRVAESIRAKGMFLYPHEIEKAVSAVPSISRFQTAVTRSGLRDQITFSVELADEGTDKEELLQELQRRFQDTCRVRIDKVEFVPKGTILEEHKVIVDKRTWE